MSTGGAGMADTHPEAQQGSRPSNYNIANALTVLRVLLVPVVAGFLVPGGQGTDAAHAWLRLAAFAAFVAASITDRIDGELARSRGLITDFGKIADPIADKLLLGTVLVVLSALGEVPWWITIVIGVREWGITLLRFWVIRYGVISASPGGKLKTVLQILALGLYILPWDAWLHGTAARVEHVVALVLLLAALAATVVTGVDYVVRAARLRAGGRVW